MERLVPNPSFHYFGPRYVLITSSGWNSRHLILCKALIMRLQSGTNGRSYCALIFGQINMM